MAEGAGREDGGEAHHDVRVLRLLVDLRGYRELFDRAAALPWVEAAGAASRCRFRGDASTGSSGSPAASWCRASIRAPTCGLGLQLRATSAFELLTYGFLDEFAAIPLPPVNLTYQVGGKRHRDPLSPR
jgi:hypothetical protein